MGICYFINVLVIIAKCKLGVLREPKPLSLGLYKWLKKTIGTFQLQIAFTQGSNLRWRCDDNHDKSLLLAENHPNWSKWVSQAVMGKPAASSCSVSPPSWEWNSVLVLKVCSLTSLSWRVFPSGLGLGSKFSPSSCPYPSNKWLTLSGWSHCRRESHLPVSTLLSWKLILHLRHLESMKDTLLLASQYWITVFLPKPTPVGAR